MKTQLPEPAGYQHRFWTEDQVRAAMVAAYLEGVEESKTEIKRLTTQPDTVEDQCAHCGNIDSPDRRNSTFQLRRALKAEDEIERLREALVLLTDRAYEVKKQDEALLRECLEFVTYGACKDGVIETLQQRLGP